MHGRPNADTERMERIRPSDLENVEFKRSLGGYDVVQVHKLLLRAAQEISSLTEEIERLQTENTRLEPLQEQAGVLTDAILSAQKSAAEKSAKARMEADQILAEARREAEQIVAKTQELCDDIEARHAARLNDLKWQIERLSVEKDRIAGIVKHFLSEQLESIENASRKYAPLSISEDQGVLDEFTTNIAEDAGGGFGTAVKS